MSPWNPTPARLDTRPDLLGFAAAATPSADAWLVAFTDYFVQHPDADAGVRALLSGLRFYTAAFVAELTALPAGAAHQPPLPGPAACAVYAATAPIIADVYEHLIRHNAPRANIADAFAQSLPGLLGHYHHNH